MPFQNTALFGRSAGFGFRFRSDLFPFQRYVAQQETGAVTKHGTNRGKVKHSVSFPGPGSIRLAQESVGGDRHHSPIYSPSPAQAAAGVVGTPFPPGPVVSASSVTGGGIVGFENFPASVSSTESGDNGGVSIRGVAGGSSVGVPLPPSHPHPLGGGRNTVLDTAVCVNFDSALSAAHYPPPPPPRLLRRSGWGPCP